MNTKGVLVAAGGVIYMEQRMEQRSASTPLLQSLTVSKGIYILSLSLALICKDMEISSFLKRKHRNERNIVFQTRSKLL